MRRGADVTGETGAVVGARGGRSLAWKLVALLGAVLAVTAAILILANQMMSRSDLEKHMIERTRIAARQLADGLSEPATPEVPDERAPTLIRFRVEGSPAL